MPAPGRDPRPHVAAFLETFNAGRFFEAHDVLEAFWLPHRGEPEADFYKALIQLAGAFVHLQKARLNPAIALLTLSQRHLDSFAGTIAGLEVGGVGALIRDWLAWLGREGVAAIQAHAAPRLVLEPGAQTGAGASPAGAAEPVAVPKSSGHGDRGC